MAARKAGEADAEDSAIEPGSALGDFGHGKRVYSEQPLVLKLREFWLLELSRHRRVIGG